MRKDKNWMGPRSKESQGSLNTTKGWEGAPKRCECVLVPPVVSTSKSITTLSSVVGDAGQHLRLGGWRLSYKNFTDEAGLL